jgi:uncharacterized membrane protein YgdD (TMEM256/DUF423 family)
MIGSLALVLGALSALISVAAGAFGAHALRGRLTPELLATFETAARYQMYHALALLAVGLAGGRSASPLWTWAGGLFVAGTLLFSGSLYALALTGIRWLGAITPLGGLCFLAGWAVLALAAWKR